MVGLGQRNCLYASVFNRHADMLSTMTHDQLLVLGNVMRLTRLYQRTGGQARDEGLQSAMSQYLGEGVQNGDFPNQDAIMSVFTQLAANGLMLFESAYGGLTWSLTPLAWEIDELVDLETVPRSEP